jgi:hypothetical protein
VHRLPAHPAIGNDDDNNVFADGGVVGRILKVNAAIDLKRS